MFRQGIAKIVVSTVITAAACTGIVYATGGLGAKQSSVVAAHRSSPAIESTGLAVETTRKPVDYYAAGITPSLFGPTPPAPKPAPKLPPPPPIKVAEPDPFGDYVYNGTVSIDGRKMALLENSKTKEGQYVSIGQPFLGGQVTAIDERQVIVSLGTTNKTVAKTDDYKLVSLDKNAPFLNEGGNPGGAPPGAPGGPPPGGPGGPGGRGMGMPGGGMVRMRGMFSGSGGPMSGAVMKMMNAPAAAEFQAAEGAVLKLGGDALVIEK